MLRKLTGSLLIALALALASLGAASPAAAWPGDTKPIRGTCPICGGNVSGTADQNLWVVIRNRG